MRADDPLTIFYDASCPVCDLEMDHLHVRLFARHRKPLSRALAPFIVALRERRARRAVAAMDACAAEACRAPEEAGATRARSMS